MQDYFLSNPSTPRRNPLLPNETASFRYYLVSITIAPMIRFTSLITGSGIVLERGLFT